MSPRLSGRHSARRPPVIMFSIEEGATMARALDAAIAHVFSLLAAPCPDCQDSTPCDRRAGDMNAAGEYRQLRSEIGALLPRSDDRWGGLLK